MLQQTQVATATPYFTRFIARWPDVRSFAAASLDDVLAAWAGLGYYRRARMLHAAAVTVVREHGGRVPGDPAAFAALPGVGRYTTGAVMSLGFGHALPVLDGNVARVFARWEARPWQVKRPADARALWALAASRVPARDAGAWNEALMELGATVCTPRAPRCDACPVSRGCRAFALGRAERYPPAAARRTSERQRRAVAWIERRGRVLVTPRRGALLDGLWEPPGVELDPGADARRALAARLRALGVRARLIDSGARVRHTITHRTIDVELWRGDARPAPRAGRALRWADPKERALALTALTRKLAARRGDGET
jgi:A/G-specific adenine glycosylase